MRPGLSEMLTLKQINPVAHLKCQYKYDCYFLMGTVSLLKSDKVTLLGRARVSRSVNHEQLLRRGNYIKYRTHRFGAVLAQAPAHAEATKRRD